MDETSAHSEAAQEINISQRDIDALTEIAKRHYRTGEFGQARLRVTPAMFAALVAQFPAPATEYPLVTISTNQLHGISIELDEDPAAPLWRLIDSTTGETLAGGHGQG